MNNEHKNQSKSRKNEIIIAVIGLLGILVTATFSNWDKIFPNPNEFRANYSGYRATGNFETEYRYFFEVSGTRLAIESMQQHLTNALRMNLITENPDNALVINVIMDASVKEAITIDEVIKKFLPIYRKHFTIEELQELNKFYSTEIMQNMIRKTPVLTQEAAPLQAELLQDFQSRFMARVEKDLGEIDEGFSILNNALGKN